MMGKIGGGSRIGMSGQHISSAGWTVALGWSKVVATPLPADATSPALTRRDFHAVTLGEDFGAPRRGLVAAVASGSGPGSSAREAAEITCHALSEGYYGATPTLGTGRAAGRALASLNTWMYEQSRADAARAGMVSAVSAIILSGRSVGLVHIGDSRLYRCRRGKLTALSTDHLRPLGDGHSGLSRGIGIDLEIRVDFAEDKAEPFDRYILLSQGVVARLSPDYLADALIAEMPPEALAESLAATLREADDQRDDATLMVLDILAQPEASFDDLAAGFADLPLKDPPKEGDNWDGFLIGRTLYRSRYTLLKLAQDTVENRQVVLKIPLPFMLQDTVFHAGFLREAWVGTTVRSPYVARYIDLPAGRRSSLYLVMPYYRGETLEDRLSRPPRVSYAEGLGIALKLTKAVRDLAAIQVIHRDLKPENIILLNGDPSGSDVRLLDLGLSYLPGIDDPDDNRMGGTTRYMAPELFRGGAATPRTEVFSLGVTVYRMFSHGEFPFGQREKVPLARLRPDLPAWVGVCLAQAIHLDPGSRYASAEDFARALEHGLLHGSEEGDAAPPRGWRRINPVRLWQGIALFWALAFVATLCLLHHK